MGNMNQAVTLCGDDRGSVALFEVVPQVIGIECLVCHQGLERQAFNQIVNTDNLTALAWKQFEADQIAQGVGERENFRGQSAL